MMELCVSATLASPEQIVHQVYSSVLTLHVLTVGHVLKLLMVISAAVPRPGLDSLVERI